MNPYRVLGLLDCQLDKLAADKGEKAATDYAVKLINERAEEGTDATPLQIRLWREGYTCTPEEVDGKVARGITTATATATATASATAGLSERDRDITAVLDGVLCGGREGTVEAEDLHAVLLLEANLVQPLKKSPQGLTQPNIV
jgi:hypothetical protein